jgi:hypothetical protein
MSYLRDFCISDVSESDSSIINSSANEERKELLELWHINFILFVIPDQIVKGISIIRIGKIILLSANLQKFAASFFLI